MGSATGMSRPTRSVLRTKSFVNVVRLGYATVPYACSPASVTFSGASAIYATEFMRVCCRTSCPVAASVCDNADILVKSAAAAERCCRRQYRVAARYVLQPPHYYRAMIGGLSPVYARWRRSDRQDPDMVSFSALITKQRPVEQWSRRHVTFAWPCPCNRCYERAT